MSNEKRARQKANRQARLAELRRAQQRRRNLKRGGVVAAIVVAALVAALLTTLLGGGGGKKHVASTSPTSSTTVPSTTTTTTPVAPLAAAKLDTYLTARTPPAKGASCSNPSTPTSTPTTTVPAKGGAVSQVAAPPDVGFPALNGTSPRYTKFSSAPPFCIDVDDTYTATMKTTAGTITIELLPKYAPVTVNDFIFLAAYHYFDGMTFFRVIPGFASQAGSPANSETGTPAGPGFTLPDEYPKSLDAYDSGAVAMANTGKPDTGGSQFFFVDGDGGEELGSPSYTVFGQITKGLSAADKINAGGNSNSADNGIPPEITYKIESVSISVATP